MNKKNLVDTFLCVSKTLNFRKAAAELGISQQAVSKNISRLESRLGFSLLYRDTHSVALTEYGKEFLVINSDYTKKLSELRIRFQTDNNTCLIETIQPKEFAPVHDLKSLHIEETDTELLFHVKKTDPEAALFHLMNNEIDMVVIMDSFIPKDTELIIQKIASLEICLLVSKKNPLYHEGITYQELQNEPFVAKTSMDNLFGISMTFIDKDIQRLHLSPNSIIMLNASEDRRTFLAKGSGITLVPLSPSSIPPEGFALIPTNRSAHIVCAWNPDSTKHYLRKVADYIQEEFEKKGYLISE